MQDALDGTPIAVVLYENFLGDFMTSRISLRMTLLGLALMLFVAVGVKASNVDNRKLSHPGEVSAVPPGAGALGSASFLFQFNDDRDREKKHHVVTPEPASWLYIVAAAMLIVVWERKSLKSRFSDN
jgi:hypothetical protein